MQKIDKENGCLFVKPGSHTGKLLKHEYPNDGQLARQCELKRSSI